MNKNKGYNDYTNIDNVNTQKIELGDVAYKKNKSNTLDLYSEEMSKKAVNNLYKGFVDKTENKNNEVDKSIYGYDGSERIRNGKKSLNKLDVTKYEEDTEVEFKGHSYNADKVKRNFDFRTSSFSSDQINTDKIDREQIKKNKEILKKMEMNNKSESLENYKKPSASKTVYHPIKKRRKTAYFRMASFFVFVLLLVCLTVSILKNNSLNSQVTALNLKVKSLTNANNDLSKLEIDNQDLKNQIAALQNPNASDSSGQNTGSTVDKNNSTAVNTNDSKPIATPAPNGASTTYTVQSGDTLSKISKKFYNDSNGYAKIVAANKLTATSNLSIGEKLTIPK